MSGVPILTNVASGYRMLVETAWVWDPADSSFDWTWTDVTTDVWQPGNVTITIGRANEAAVAQPGNCSLRLKNPSGNYTPANPASTNYPNVVMGVPLRVSVSVDGGTTWRVRFFGYVSSWAPGWDAQGKFAYVAVTASGTTRRLGSGSKPLRSALYRATLADGPIEYWPLEDGTSAGQGASAVSRAALAVTSTPVNFAQDTTGLPGGTEALPDLSGGGELISPVTGSVSASGYAISFLFRSSASTSAPIRWGISSGSFAWVRVDMDSGLGVSVNAFTSTGSEVGFVSTGTNYSDGDYHFARIVLTQSGGDIDAELWVDGLQVSSNTSTGVTLGAPFYVQLNPRGASGLGGDVDAVGHVAIFSGTGSNSPASAVDGYTGETVDDRLLRLCVTEEGIPLNRIGTSDTAMGAQGVDTLMNLLRECETTDGGVLFDGLQQDFTYVSRNNLYNESAALTIDANSRQVPASPGPLPVFDDQRILNRITVTRTNGSFVEYEDANGSLGTAVIGVRDGRVLVNTESDRQLKDIATWRVHQGTVNEMRYPQVLFDLAAAPELASDWVVTTVTDRIDLTNLSDQLTQHPTGTVSLLIEGWTEVLSSRSWRVAVNCSQFRAWEVFKIADSRLGRIETDGSTLHQNYSAGVTSILVDSSDGLWTTGAVSFDVEIRGWQIHVTNISGSSSPQTFTVSATPAELGSGDSVKLWKPGVLAL